MVSSVKVPEAGGDTRHGEGYQVVEVAIGRRRQLKSSEANIIKCLIVNAVCFVRVFNQLVQREGSIVRLHHRVRHLWKLSRQNLLKK